MLGSFILRRIPAPRSRATRALVSIVLALVINVQASGARAAEPESPWTVERGRALVRITVPEGTNERVGTGFIVRGNGDNYYVVTSTHTILPASDGTLVDLQNCQQIFPGTVFQEGDRGGQPLVTGCVKHLGHDVSVVRLEPRDIPYAYLVVGSCNIVVSDWLFVGGFPIMLPKDVLRHGQVTATKVGNDDFIVINAPTAQGMSGGPYLAPTGTVVAVHRGGAISYSGFAQAIPIWQVKNNLESVLGGSLPCPAQSNQSNSSATPAVIAAIKPRRDVVITQYTPATQKDVLDEYLGIFRQKIMLLPGTFSFSDDEHLGDLSIRNANQVLTAAQLANHWRQFDSSLVLMSGTIFVSTNPHQVSSSIYVGEPNKLFAIAQITTLLPVVPEAALNARDSNTVMLLYALAKDAYARHKDDAIVASYLSEAQETAIDLASNDPQFNKLLTEISKTLAGLKK